MTAATDGTLSLRDGSFVRPFNDLAAALENPLLKPGQTIFLFGGIHYIDREVVISTSDITVQPYQDDEAEIVFRCPNNTRMFLRVQGNNVRFRHLNIRSNPASRQSPMRKQYVGAPLAWISIESDAPHDGLFADCRLHDMGHVGWFAGSRGGCIYRDCDLYNFGWATADGGHDGEFLYTQNAPGAPIKHVRNTIFSQAYSTALQVYGINGPVSHYHFDRIIVIQSGLFYISSGLGVDDITITDSAFLNNWFIAGDATLPNGMLSISGIDHAHIHGIRINDWNNLALTNTRSAVTLLSTQVPMLDSAGHGRRDINHNAYYAPRLQTFWRGDEKLTFNQWQAEGHDLDSSYTHGLPSDNWIRIYPCSTQGAKRIAHIAIFNWQQLDTVSADVTALDLQTGATYRLRNALDPLNDTEMLIYDGSGAISIGMADRSVAAPIGGTGPLRTWDKRYGAFILESV